jgi:DNA repair exonuclease SbcCD nuclease subunit
LGDFLEDRREINILVLNKIKILLNKIEEYKIPCYYLLGNHDVFYKNDNSINGIGPLLEDFNYQRIIDEPTIFERKRDLGFDIICIPWINNINKKQIYKFLKGISDKENTIVFGHFSFEEIMDIPFSERDSELNISFFKQFKKVYSGHFHLNTKMNNIIYVGSILDFKWGEELSDHGFYIIDKNKEEFIKNKENIHIKYSINTKEDLINVLNNCSQKEIKLILSKDLTMSNKEYDYYISLIDKSCYKLQVLSFDNFNSFDINNEITVKTFEEYIINYFKDKSYGADIDNVKLIKIFLKLYNISNKEENNV